jgi:hypothetical protein
MSPEERAQLIAEIAVAIGNSRTNELTEEERQWVRLAIAAEARKIKFRDAVIEKTLAGLVWAGIAGIGYVLLDFFRNHGLKV